MKFYVEKIIEFGRYLAGSDKNEALGPVYHKSEHNEPTTLLGLITEV
mgnify:CR=1 FL=1